MGTQKLPRLNREANREAVPIYDAIAPIPALGFPFAHRIYATAYTSWPKLPELFPTSFPGIKTSRDPLVVEVDRHALVERICFYLDQKNKDGEVAASCPTAMEDTATFDPHKTRSFLIREFNTDIQLARENGEVGTDEQIGRKIVGQKIRKFLYRPFDQRFLYWEELTT